MTFPAYFEPDIETMPRAQLEAFQEDCVLEMLPYAYERSSLIRSTWEAAGVHPKDITNLDDFRAHAPFIDKDAIRRFRDEHGDPFGGLLCVDLHESTLITSSSGTTGEPTLFAERVSRYPLMQLVMARYAWGMGVRPGDRILSVAATSRGNSFGLGHLIGAVPLMMNTWTGNWPEIFDVIEKYQPVYMHLQAPQLIDLEHLSATYDIAERLAPLKAVTFGGEPLGLRMRERIREWGLNLFDMRGSGDIGCAIECEKKDGAHLWEDLLLPESVDPDGRDPVATGELGELVSTALDDAVAPLVRFRSGDLVRFTTETCGCGRTHARQWTIGRKGDETIVDGHTVLPFDVWTAVEKVPESAAGVFQIVRPQREVDELKVRVGYQPAGARPIDSVRDDLSAAILAETGVVPVIELVTEAEILGRSNIKIARVVKA